MAYGRFDVEKKHIMLTPDQVIEYSFAAEKHYTYDYAYHNWDHALEVARGTEVISGKLEARGLVIAKGALLIAASWHDAGYHEDHVSKGFRTKEEYSAALLERYLEGKSVGEWEKSMMLKAIIATEVGYWNTRAPYDLILHRADVANIGGPTDEFIENSVNLWKEARHISGDTLSWRTYVERASRFVKLASAEHDNESTENFLDVNDTTLDVYDTPFKLQAMTNIEALKKYVA